MGWKQLFKPHALVMSILSIITIAAVCVSVWTLFFRQPEVSLPPDYAPIEKEPNQKPIEDDNSEKMDMEDGGGAVNISYSNEVFIDLSDRKAELYFGNPGKSTHDMVVEIVVQEQVLFRSGRLLPGNEIEELVLKEESIRMLNAGGYEGIFRISYYDPVTREKSIINTKIPIQITVQE